MPDMQQACVEVDIGLCESQKLRPAGRQDTEGARQRLASFCRKTHKTLIPRQLCRASGVGMPTLPSPARPPIFREQRIPKKRESGETTSSRVSSTLATA